MLRTPCSPEPGAIIVRSDDGAVRYVLRPTPLGLLVERHRWRKGVARTALAAVFSDATHFARWCEADSTRFDYPVLHHQLRRHGDSLLQQHGAPPHHAG